MGSREDILAAAEREFTAKGFRGASLRKIAADAGLTTGAVYGYFKSKADLFQTMIHEALDNFIMEVQAVNVETSASNSRYFNLLTHFTEDEKMRKAYLDDYMVFYKKIYGLRKYFLMLLYQAEGSGCEHIIRELTERDGQNALQIYCKLRGVAAPAPEMQEVMELFFVHSFRAFTDLIAAYETFEAAEPSLRIFLEHNVRSFLAFLTI